MRHLLILLATICLTGAAPAKKKHVHAKKEKNLHETNYQEIIKNYLFVADFGTKEAERPVSKEPFWRYPYKINKVEFPLIPDFENLTEELPATPGEGLVYQHLNRGRMMYLSGEYEEAKNTWLAARARFGKEYPHHRRNDYFIAYAYLKLGMIKLAEKNNNYADPEVRSLFGTAASFLSWASIVKDEFSDSLVEKFTPKGLYNLAAIYFRYERFAGAYGAATKGLEYDRKTGRKDYRMQFHRYIAEGHIANRTYLEALQEFDTALRQDVDKVQAAIIFARVGDIYFDLNNYELAEDNYALANRIDIEIGQLTPEQFIRRGEALFWLGKFSEAQKMFYFGIDASAKKNARQPLSNEYVAWATLRIADAYLARHEIEKSKLDYFKVARDFQTHEIANVAKVRSACLELPAYDGNNVKHARNLLEEAKDFTLPESIMELVWACQVGSYTARERTKDMVERVRSFANKYPESPFLKDMADPVRTVQATMLDEYFAKKDAYTAISFFEKNRKTLFPIVSPERQQKLFVAYVDAGRIKQASEFWPAYEKVAVEDLAFFRLAAVTSDLGAVGGKTIWSARNLALGKKLKGRSWKIKAQPFNLNYYERIATGPGGDAHLAWMLELTKTWSDKSDVNLCSLEFPLLSRTLATKGQKLVSPVGILARTQKIIDERLPAMLEDEKLCGFSLLDFEMKQMSNQPKNLAARYLKRQDWPLKPAIIGMSWALSEKLLEVGEKSTARQLWQWLAEKGPSDAPEVLFAKTRLNPGESELDGIWKQ